MDHPPENTTSASQPTGAGSSGKRRSRKKLTRTRSKAASVIPRYPRFTLEWKRNPTTFRRLTSSSASRFPDKTPSFQPNRAGRDGGASTFGDSCAACGRIQPLVASGQRANDPKTGRLTPAARPVASLLDPDRFRYKKKNRRKEVAG